MSKSGPPPKKMVHLESVNSLPAKYSDFRTVIWTGESSQLVYMTVPVGGDIGEEVSCLRIHPYLDGEGSAPRISATFYL